MSHKVLAPWTWDGEFPLKVRDANGDMVCQCFPSAAEHIVPLIKAAPLMLEALEYARTQVGSLYMTDPVKVGPILTGIDAAIKAARGEA